MRILFLVLGLSFAIIPAAGYARWYKGSTHTHTCNSDGDSSPDAVVRWYREHGYSFIVITDHNFLTNVKGLNSIFTARDKFLVIAGEEVTDRYESPEGREYALHVNAINIDSKINPVGGKGGVRSILQDDLDAIKAAGGLSTINHPNFYWSINAETLYSLKNCNLFEILNVSTNCNNLGGGGLPGIETLWDSVLTRGKLVFAVASDDAHDFKVHGPQYSNPGGAFVQVRADSLEAIALTTALEEGNFYSSTGVELKDISITEKQYVVEFESKDQTRHTVYFIGQVGKTLQTSFQSPAIYEITGKEGYVRAKVIDSNGFVAWTQPVFTGKQ